MFLCVFSGNREVKVKVKGIGSFSFLIEKGQQDGNGISHNSDTGGEGKEVSATGGKAQPRQSWL